MKLIYIIILFVVFPFLSVSQISQKDQKGISKIIGGEFVGLPVQEEYPYAFYADSFKVDMSTTLENDTVGVSFHNEHLMWHDLITFNGGEEVLKLINTKPVSTAEYIEFQNYVRDSTTRDHIYLNVREQSYMCLAKARILSDEDAKEWLSWEVESDVGSSEVQEVDISDRALMRALYNLNWEKKLNYDDPTLLPLIYDLYSPSLQMDYRKKRKIDDRKLFYRYSNFVDSKTMWSEDSMSIRFPFRKLTNYVDNENTAVISDPYNWGTLSSVEHDEYSVLAQTYNDLQLNSPCIGVNGPQAKAYCHWKQAALQKELDHKNLPYKVIVTLPTHTDLSQVGHSELQFTIPEKNYTNQWRILNEDYNQFIEAVKDSILREFIVLNSVEVEERKKYLDYKDIYFNEERFEYTEYDYGDIKLGRSLFSLNYESKLKSFCPSTQEMVDTFIKSIRYEYPMYSYYTIDAKAKAYPGLFETYENDAAESNLYLSNQKDTNYFRNYYVYHYGKDLDLSYTNALNQSTSVRSNEDDQQFIIKTSIVVNPKPETDNSNRQSLTKGITYEHALAFYAWKYPIHQAITSDNWQKFVLPTKEQFEAVQRGEQLVVQGKRVAYPTPVFRYVVHVYKK